MIGVGFVLEGSGWLGGVNYYRNLFSVLTLLPERNIDPYIFVGTHVSEELVRNFRHAKVIRTALLDSKTVAGFARRVANKLSGRRDPLVSILMRLYGIRLLSHSGAAMPGLGIKSLGWIPDFQHLHLPEFHGEKECSQRDDSFKNLVKKCDGVVLSSHAALTDLAAFSPDAVHKARVLHFVPEVDASIEDVSVETLEEKYGFKSPYFFVPNQFWAHKNHKVVIEAMVELKARGICPYVLFSGDTRDYRNPRHFATLTQTVNDLGLNEFFKILGVIPYSDLLALLNDSVALINPSLFEGWSSTVEEAKALDKRVLLSNIAVHLEQNPRKGFFFEARDHQCLADLMQSALMEWESEKEKRKVPSYNPDYERNRVAFALDYQKIVFELLNV